MSEQAVLVAMRLVDMARVHPAQDNSRLCSRCGEKVGIYPSGQRALKTYPLIVIECVPCAFAGRRAGDIDLPAAGTLDEIRQEIRESREVPKA